MINMNDIMETITMIQEEHLDIRTITMGISLLDCCDPDIDRSCQKVYDKITACAKNLVKAGEDIETRIRNPDYKQAHFRHAHRHAGGASGGDPVKYAKTLDRARKEVGSTLSAAIRLWYRKDFTAGDKALIESIPRALAETEFVCSSVNVGSTKTGINMDAVELMGKVVKEAAELTADRDCIGAAKLVVFCNAPEDNPFMAGAFHGPGEPECVINVGVSGPGVVRAALTKCPDADLTDIADIIKKTAFKITRMGQLVGTEASRRLGVPFGIVDLSLAPTPAVGDSVAHILEEMGLAQCGCSRHYRRAGLVKRRGEKRRRDGLVPCGRALRRVYSGYGGRGYDRRRPDRLLCTGKAGSHDRCLLGRTGHDCLPWRYSGGGDCCDHCRRSGHWYGQLQNYRSAHDPGHRQKEGEELEFRRPAGQRPGHAGQPVSPRKIYPPWRSDSGAAAEFKKLKRGVLICHLDVKRFLSWICLLQSNISPIFPASWGSIYT